MLQNSDFNITAIHHIITTALIGQDDQPIIASESLRHMATLSSLLLNWSRKVYFDLLWGKFKDFRSLNVSILTTSYSLGYSVQISRKCQLILELYLKKNNNKAV